MGVSLFHGPKKLGGGGTQSGFQSGAQEVSKDQTIFLEGGNSHIFLFTPNLGGRRFPF